jgi:hypothetical protein
MVLQVVKHQPHAMRTMTLQYGANRSNYSLDEDRFLVCMMNAHGFDNFEKIKAEIKKCPLFRFDYQLKFQYISITHSLHMHE